MCERITVLNVFRKYNLISEMIKVKSLILIYYETICALNLSNNGY